MSGSSRFRTIPVALCGLALISACGDGDDDAGPTTPKAETTTTEDTQAATEAEIVAAYEDHWVDFLRAGNPPAPDADYLADHATGQVLEGTLEVLQQYQAEGVGIRGTYDTDAEVALLRSTSAVVEDCGLDRSELFRLSSGEVVEGSDGERDGLRVTLMLEDGAWKVSLYERDEELCEA